MTEFIQVDTGAVRDHANDVQGIVTGALDGGAAAVRETATMTHVFGLICSPLLAPPITALALVADAQISTLLEMGESITLGLKATAEIYDAVEDGVGGMFGGGS